MDRTCPICGAKVRENTGDPSAGPFCSARCRAVDLGRWLDGAYALPLHDEAPSEGDLAAVPPNSGDARRWS